MFDVGPVQANACGAQRAPPVVVGTVVMTAQPLPRDMGRWWLCRPTQGVPAMDDGGWREGEGGARPQLTPTWAKRRLKG